MLEGWDLRKILPALEERAVAYVREQAKAPDQPFFLYMPLTAPHTPIAPDEPYVGKSQAGAYGDFVHQVDAVVGSVMDAAEETGQAQNTLFIFTSDNGSPARDGTNMSGKPGSVKRFGHNPSFIFRGMKWRIWEGGHRVPFFVRWPGKVPAGSRCAQLACTTDIMRTCAEIVGTPLPDHTAEDSVSLMPLLSEATDQPVRDSVVHHDVSGRFAYRKGKWKLIPGRPAELFDMEADPRESKNLLSTEPERAQTLLAELQALADAGRSTPGEEQPNDRAVRVGSIAVPQTREPPPGQDKTGDFAVV
jgi:arylsulfatase A-like enzyme